MALQLFYVASLLLFAMELYHVIAHVMILFGLRTLPRRDLVRIRFYFLVDTLTVFSSSFLLTGKLRWLAVIQIVQHMFYFITWEKSYMSKRIIDWSSLDWFRSTNKGSPQVDSFFGTLFDVIVHVCMMYAISEHLDMTAVIIAVIIAQAALYSVIFNPRFAWSSPNKMPEWVQKRLGKLALQY